jgi:stringent starvation protein B
MLALLERASVFIHLDPRHDEVRVPPWFKKQPQLTLQVGLNMAVRIPDLAVEDDAVSCTLSFSRSPFFCYVPWAAVFALVGEDGKGMVWPNDVPKEVAAQQAEQAKKQEARARLAPAEPAEKAQAAGPTRSTGKSSGKPRGAKKRTPGKAPEPAPRPAAEQPARAAASTPAPNRESKRPLPPYLRVVK